MATTSLIHARRLRRAVLAGTLLACAFPAAALADRAPALPASASSSIVPETCPPEAEGAVCGHVVVPFDRADPGAGTIPIVFELYPHTRSRPGGERDHGQLRRARRLDHGAARASRSLFVGVARQPRPTADRRPRSRALGRHRLPRPTSTPPVPLLAIVAACAEQLGAQADRYATAEIAHDNEAVRAALGYEPVDFVGTSYGGIDAAAYATRFGRPSALAGAQRPLGRARLSSRSTVATFGVRTLVDRIGLLCERSRACGRSGARGRRRGRAGPCTGVRRSPVNGTGARRRRRDPRRDHRPGSCSSTSSTAVGLFLTPGEIPAAAEALRRGDAAPLLRLAADADFPIPGDNGDPSFLLGRARLGDLLRRPAVAVVAGRPAHACARPSGTGGPPDADAPFAPFTRRGGHVQPLRHGADFCLPWPATGSRPPVEPGARYPKVPTLDPRRRVRHARRRRARRSRDTRTPSSSSSTAPDTPRWSGATARGTSRHGFLRTRGPATRAARRSRCSTTPAWPPFPRRTAESPAAAPPVATAPAPALRVARVAADAALDALKRSILISQRRRRPGPACAAATFQTDDDEACTTTLTGVALDRGRRRQRHAALVLRRRPARRRPRVDGPGRRDGTLHLEGGWLIPGAPRSIAITGTLGGEHVAATVPST